MKKKLSIIEFSNLLFGRFDEMMKVTQFLSGDYSERDVAKDVLSNLTHPELKSAYADLTLGISLQKPNAIYKGDEKLYRSNKSMFDYSQTLLFQPEMRQLVLEPFVGLIESENPGFRYEQGPGDLRLAFRNVGFKGRERVKSPFNYRRNGSR
jgi:hypothetical protein